MPGAVLWNWLFEIKLILANLNTVNVLLIIIILKSGRYFEFGLPHPFYDKFKWAHLPAQHYLYRAYNSSQQLFHSDQHSRYVSCSWCFSKLLNLFWSLVLFNSYLYGKGSEPILIHLLLPPIDVIFCTFHWSCWK